MSDFSSAAMMRLIREGLIAQNLALPNLQLNPIEMQPKPKMSAHASLHAKRALLQLIFQEYGPLSLLNIGQAVRHVRDEPALRALTLARDPMDLIRRWQQLEKFIHSRHRIQVLAAAPDRVTLKHFAPGQEQPSSAESLLVFGLLTALIEIIDGCSLKARCLPQLQNCRDDVRWSVEYFLSGGELKTVDVSSWEFLWVEGASTHSPKSAVARPNDNNLTRARAVIAADPSCRWALDDLANQMRLPVRTFQRQLADQGTSFSELLKNERLTLAATLLTQSTQAPAEIGYCCGFSDQSHFSREFKRHTAMTPNQYRASFSISARKS
jgi:AraC-like DNA-binding protein